MHSLRVVSLNVMLLLPLFDLQLMLPLGSIEKRSGSPPKRTSAPCYYINAFMIAAMPKRQAATLTLMFSVKRKLMVKPSDHAGAIQKGCVRPVSTSLNRCSLEYRPTIDVLEPSPMAPMSLPVVLSAGVFSLAYWGRA